MRFRKKSSYDIFLDAIALRRKSKLYANRAKYDDDTKDDDDDDNDDSSQ